MKVGDKAYLLEGGRIEVVELVAEVAGGFLVKSWEGDKIANLSSLYEIREEDGWNEKKGTWLLRDDRKVRVFYIYKRAGGSLTRASVMDEGK